jgi:hypothetical protein
LYDELKPDCDRKVIGDVPLIAPPGEVGMVDNGYAEAANGLLRDVADIGV